MFGRVGAVAQGLSEYELLRQKRIEENEAFMLRLGLAEDRAAIVAIQAADISIQGRGRGQGSRGRGSQGGRGRGARRGGAPARQKSARIARAAAATSTERRSEVQATSPAQDSNKDIIDEINTRPRRNTRPPQIIYDPSSTAP
eukprot:COSAG01_NODE_31330_length_599_cov_1.616000_1_plen_142_part_10